MGGGAASVPLPDSTASNHHLPLPCSPAVSSFSPNFRTQSSNFINESERSARWYSNQTCFGPVPFQTEVQNAIFDLQRVMNGFPASISELDGTEETERHTHDSSRTLMNSLGQKRLLDAYHLLQTDPLVQRLVLSISTDTGVWDAIMKNDAVQDLQGLSSHTATEEKDTRYKQEPDSASLILKWIFAFLKSKFIEFIENLEVFVFETLQLVYKKNKSTSKHDDLLEEKVRSSLLLSVVILVIVVVTRSAEA